MGGYVWYSFGSDKTGPILGQALEFDAGKKTPNYEKYDVVIGWGCKPGNKYDPQVLAQLIAQNQVRILNHPDAVDANRDKLATLTRLKERGISVPGFLGFNPNKPKGAGTDLIPAAIESGELSLPLVLLTRYNQGEPVFCYTLEDVKVSLKGNSEREEPICYARSFDQSDEYRVHVFRDTALCAQKKNMAADPIAATRMGIMSKAKKAAGKEGIALDEATSLFLVSLMADELLSSASQLKKSTKMGWEWVDWGMDLVPQKVAAVAIDAMDAVGLDMGAVSVSYVDGTARVLSVTTAPALDADQMGLFVSEIHGFINEDGKTKDPAAKKEAKNKRMASPELVARLYRKMRGLSEEKAEEVLKSLEE